MLNTAYCTTQHFTIEASPSSWCSSPVPFSTLQMNTFSFRYQTAILPIPPCKTKSQSTNTSKEKQFLELVLLLHAEHLIILRKICCLQDIIRKYPPNSCIFQHNPYLPNRSGIIFWSYWFQFSKWLLKWSDAPESNWNDRLLQGHWMAHHKLPGIL